MSVFNGAAYLREAIESILSQSYRDFRFIIIDDGSTDESPKILASYRDPRVMVISQANQGLAAALNRGLAEADGEFIARQDHDDVSLPDRLAEQVRFLDAHHEVGLAGTGAEIVHPDGSLKWASRPWRNPVILKWRLLFGNPFLHSSVMIRRRALEEVGVYTTDSTRQPPEDYELWSRLANRWQVANLSRPLIRCRKVPDSLSRSLGRSMETTSAMISLENLRRLKVSELHEVELERILGFVLGWRHPETVLEAYSVLKGLWVLERAFCAHHHLSRLETLGLKAHNRVGFALRAYRVARHLLGWE